MKEKRLRNNLVKTSFFSFKFVVLLLLFVFLQELPNQLYAEELVQITAGYGFGPPRQHSVEPSPERPVEYPSTPERVVEAFCKEDYNGAGLNTFGWPRIHQYTTWADAPGWDVVTVVSAYTVTNVKKGPGTAEVKVVYEVIGELLSGEKLSSIEKNLHTDVVQYKLIKENEKWKIEGPQKQPHISVNIAIQELKDEMKGIADKELLKKAHEDIEFLKRYTQ